MQTITNSTESAALGTRLWKAFLLLLVPILAALQIWSLTTWYRYAVPEGRATLGVTLGDPARGGRLSIVAMDAASPLAGVGANLGDVLVFDRSGDAAIRGRVSFLLCRRQTWRSPQSMIFTRELLTWRALSDPPKNRGTELGHVR